MRRFMFVAGLAVGYVLGAKAGRERYDQIVDVVRRIRENPTVHNTATTLRQQAENMASASKDKFMNSDLGGKLFRDDELKQSMDTHPGYWERTGISTSTSSSSKNPATGPND
ncbi:hypothetical protein FB566_4619 [Stackebrandtia endophytica]|uniref:Uncharacterized protein n=1 Tax=Stackebrandtia endophytica TaxID=1496996 RepID=A0A543B2F0_9ACTN|nr:hypothetical protein [Stackebrandtia endophytica]TQL79019.1 hypothetical protein FB566_4619 [Stackebrandtia endophytica]